MKELVKPNLNEQKQCSVEQYCETDCNTCAVQGCNKYCGCLTDIFGRRNGSVAEDEDILF